MPCAWLLSKADAIVTLPLLASYVRTDVLVSFPVRPTGLTELKRPTDVSHTLTSSEVHLRHSARQ